MAITPYLLQIATNRIVSGYIAHSELNFPSRELIWEIRENNPLYRNKL